MPCFDKKLEASREELTDIAWASTSTESQTTPVRDVDCVITTRELLTLASARGLSLPSLPLKALPASCSTPFPDQALDSFLFSKSSSGQTVESGTSGGYLHHVLKIFQARNPGSKIVTQRGRNADVVEYVLMSSGDEPLLKAARYYGFRNIQNLVRKLKPARVSRLPGAKPQAVSSSASRRQPLSRNATPAGTGADYAYVEVMACPGGCTNGGGQIRIEDAREAIPNTLKETSAEAPVSASKPTPHEQRAWLARVDEAYYSADSDSEGSVTTEPVSVLSRDTEIHEFLKYWSEKIDIPLSQLAYTSYREVESDVGKTQNAPNETARVVELAGKIGGGW
jgi:iron only hydrogenase large subunit-like protein